MTDRRPAAHHPGRAPEADQEALLSHPWVPWEPEQVAPRLESTGRPWLIAGGFAIDLFVGRRTRDHADLDVFLLRLDQRAVHEALPDWEIYAADPPGRLRPWAVGEALPVGVHDIWCRPSADEPWRVQFMLDEAEDQSWVSRRNPQVRRPLGELRHTTTDGIPFLAPEVQLFYKARARRAKDEQDLDTVLPHLSQPQRDWLRHAIHTTEPAHPWLVRLPH